jgi:hypothetical protein
MKINKIIAYAGAMLIATACSNDQTSNDWGNVALEVNATINAEATTRLGTTATAFAQGDKITVFASEGGTVTGYTYTAAGDGTFSSTNGYLFNTEEKVKFFAYYPAADSDEITLDLTKQGDDLDLLFADEVTSQIALPTVNFVFDHLLSKLTFVLNDGGGFSSFKDATVTLKGFEFTQATCYLKENRIASDVDSSPRTIEAILTTEESSDDEGTVTSTSTAEAIIFPETDKQDFTLTISLNGIDYTKELSITPKSGTNYRYEVTVTKQGLYIASPTITAWNDVTSSGELSLKIPNN